MASFLRLVLLLTVLLSSKTAFCYINPGFTTSHKNIINSSYRRTYIVLVEPPLGHAVAEDDDHHRWHESFLPLSDLSDSDDQPQLIHSYSEAASGFAARLTAGELAAMSKKQGFVRAFPDPTLHLMTTHTPEFLGLSRNAAGFWKDSGYGKGVIVGVLDSGIDASHPSFADDGVSPPPARWKGSCSSSARCNNKLIGAKSLYGDDDTSDGAGHGTHTSSTAAGNFVDGAGANATATAAGVAPGAHIAMYKVCNAQGKCSGSALLGGIDAAIKDGVDVLSLSLGSNDAVRFDEDPIAIGAFAAVSRGITVVCAAGNKGPELGTLSNEAPWLLTVAAGTVDRRFSADTRLGDGKLVAGEALHSTTTSTTISNSSSHPLLYSNYQNDCDNVDTTTVNGKIVLCQLSLNTASSQQKAFVDAVKRAGAAGIVLKNPSIFGYTIILRDFGSGVVQVTVADGDSIEKYATSTEKPVATLAAAANNATTSTLLGVRPAPAVAAFSSRGPSVIAPGILKPDILAPGLNILAAWPSSLSKIGFNVISGTSMATPHVSGVAALVKSVHLDWSPAAIKSAILTTSDVVDNTGGPILDERHATASVFLTGAGHVIPARAADPGLVYDMGVADYASYICTVFGENALSIIVRNSSLKCEDLPELPEPQLNYPTITVPLDADTQSSSTVNRTVTNVGPADSTYTANVTVPAGLEVTVRVSPEKLVFSKVGEKKTFTVTVSGKVRKGIQPVAVEASLRWVSGKHVVRSPVVVTVDAVSSTPPATWQLRDGGFS
uniref:Subtilisin-like protease n=1 Tax=Leersia perrieri TaxID=77586 RepID=A0A0D9XC13_9ORYZ